MTRHLLVFAAILAALLVASSNADSARPCSKDATAQLQSQIDATPNGGTVSLTAGKCYRVEGTLNIANRTGLTFEGNGAMIRSSSPGDGHRSTLRVTNGGGHVIRNLTIEGGYGNPGVHAPSIQWSHGLDLLGVAGGLTENVTIRNVSGDCVYVGLGSGSTSSRDVTVRNVVCEGTGRNGVAAVAVNNLRVEGGSYSGIGLIAFDVEPNDGIGPGVDGAVFTGATVGSYYLDVGTIVGDNEVRNVEWSYLTVTASKGARFRVLTPFSRRRTNVSVVGNHSSFTRQWESIMAERTDGLTVTGNTLPTTTVLLNCIDVTGLTFAGNTPNTSQGCP